MFSDNNGIKLETTNRKIHGKCPNIVNLNNTFLKSTRVKVEFTREIRKHFELNKN